MTRERSPWLILGVLTIGFFMTLLDLSIVNIALPSIITDLRATLDEALWFFSAYTLAFAALLVVGGRLGDYFGPRRMYLIGLAVFVLASMASGLAHDPALLIAARAVQGIGGAMIAPQLLPITAAVFPPSKWGAAFGLSAALAGLAILAGPTLGGVIVTYLSWRWVFYVNVPIGLVALGLAVWIVPDLRPGRRQIFGFGSAAVLVAALGAVSFALIEGERLGWNGLIWALLAAGVVLLAVFAAMQRRLQDAGALVPFALFRSRNFTTMSATIWVTGFAMLAVFLPLTIYLQSIVHMSPLRAGLTIAAMPVTSILVAGQAGRLADRYGGKYFLIAGLAVFAAGILLLSSALSTSAGTGSFILPLAVVGAGTGLIFAPLFAVAFTDLDPQMSGAASGVINTSQEMGGLVATAIIGAVLQTRLVSGIRHWVDLRALSVPPQGRSHFRAAFDSLTSGSVSVTTHGPGAAPHGTDPRLVAQAVSAFGDAFISAMRTSYVIPVVVLAAGIGIASLSRRVAPRAMTAPRGKDRARGNRGRGSRTGENTPEISNERNTMTESTTAGTTIVGLYQIKQGKEDEAAALIGRHWPTLAAHGLVTGPPAKVYKGEWGTGTFFMEIATWTGDEALHAAFSIPEIASIWNDIKELSEDRNGREGVEYPTVKSLPAFDGFQVEQHDGETVTGVAIHQIRPEHVEDMKELLPREWQTLHEQGFIPRHQPQGYVGVDKYGPFSISIVDWFEASGPQKAFMNEAVNRVWRDVQSWTVGRGGRPASEYLWVEEVVTDVTPSRA